MRDAEPRRSRREELKQFCVMLALGIPGLAIGFWGFKLLESSQRPNLPAGVMIGIGGFLLLMTGYYHYRNDYAAMGRRRGVKAFLAVTFLSALAGVLTTGLLLGFAL